MGFRHVKSRLPSGWLVGVSGSLGHLKAVVFHLVVVILGPLFLVTSLATHVEKEERDEETEENEGTAIFQDGRMRTS